MELALSLGERRKPFSFMDEGRSSQKQKMNELGFCMGEKEDDDDKRTCSSSSPEPPPLQLALLPFSPVLHQSPPPSQPSHRPFPWLSQNLMAEPGSRNKPGKELEVKQLTAVSDPDNGEDQSSPNNSNSDTSSFHMDFSSILKSSIGDRSFPSIKRGLELATRSMDVRDGDYSRKETGLSDEDENGLARKKLRLTKEQSAFLEDSFKEHNTLNPKQKVALAKQLNLRPRQIEVWFQNRRARTKLKQTEVDCEYLKKCCETLNEENRRLQKELQELRALKTSQPFFMQLPATTLTMCPSCERVSTTTSAASPATTTTGRP